jgi:hypothetical protein
MATSEARTLANKANAQRSTGPSSPAGRDISRRNSLKHGLTGAGVVLIEQDVSEVEQRNDDLQAEFRPQTAFGKILVRKMATLSVRMERSEKQETAAIAIRVRHAVSEFDQGRLDEAEQLLDLLGDEPRIHHRKLMNSPEGVDRLILAWQELRADLILDPKPVWTAWHRERAENLCGFRIDDASGSRINSLSKAVWGDFAGLGDLEGGDLDHDLRQEWARDRMVEQIDAEIADLEAHYETLDFKTLDLDRAQAPDRALFDPSREATLARRYESEATRGFFKALKDLRQVEAEAAACPIAAETPAPEEAHVPLGSSRDRPAHAPRESRPMPAKSRPVDHQPVRSPVGRMESFGRTDTVSA